MKLQISNSKFSKFIDTCIALDQTSRFLGEHFNRNGVSISQDSAFLRDCVFRNNKNQLRNGTAIHTTKPIKLLNCLFAQNQGSFGGAIFTTSEIEAHFCTFFDNSAQEQAAAISIRAAKAITNITDTIFNKNKANLFGTIYRTSDQPFDFLRNNVTKSHATACVGSMETEKGKTMIKYVIFAENKADIHNGCLVVRDPLSIEVFNTIFYKNSHQSSENVVASCILIYTVPVIGKISDCLFAKNDRSNSYTIRAYYGSPLAILKTQIDEEISKAVKGDPNPKVVHFTFNSDIDIDLKWSVSEQKEMFGYQDFRKMDDSSLYTKENIIKVFLAGMIFAVTFSFILVKLFGLLFIGSKID
ncbi:hypothetical protein TVAG_056110 [Trichomonas vaginalis G3]|uniref:Uncharacterized protein n=1 Tax=Trichomonas vaginalis (strain ATCC PRA-98 / G3) TaxID=412133 RepID=A2EL64_TRIV3|nr:pectin lyase-like family [Trichomonas vaginalis G3]EAY06617.1 hypothetical protein TVAG_056110 [Trichomonas vaginalis G3]KAI5551659.1 pectin lyase-like family [Trichomonas vaginalis G3]|eukprot:XP_001318840.1 hypothetical protein [Trichomonas vaginalis G3]